MGTTVPLRDLRDISSPSRHLKSLYPNYSSRTGTLRVAMPVWQLISHQTVPQLAINSHGLKQQQPWQIGNRIGWVEIN